MSPARFPLTIIAFCAALGVAWWLGVPVPFLSPAPAGPVVAMAPFAGTGQAGAVGEELPSAIAVRLTDATGRGVPGVAVEFSVQSGGGALFLNISTTDADGVAVNRWTLGTSAGVKQTVEARTVVPTTGAPLRATFEALAWAGAPATVEAAGGMNQSAEIGQTLDTAIAVSVLDRYGNPVPGVSVTWTVRSGEGSLAPGSSISDERGIATSTWTLGAAGAGRQVVSATAAGASVDFEARARPRGGILLSEDFERGLSQWVGRPSGHHAEVVADPLREHNSVVRFTRPVAAGDLFSREIRVDPLATYILTFEYLGTPGMGSSGPDLGGFIGISDGIPGSHAWLAGTEEQLAAVELIDDGTWHSYSIPFIPAAVITTADRAIRVMLEDGEVSGGVGRDAYFDNVVLARASDR